MSVLVCIGLGGNLGDVLQTFRETLDLMPGRGLVVDALSSAYRTKPLLPRREGQANGQTVPDYWNAVCRVRTHLGPGEVLGQIHALEERAGRVRRRRWESRELDLDILLYGSVTVAEQRLHIPHPAMHERVFVLRPLCEIASAFRVQSLGKTVQELLADLNDADAGVLEVRRDWSRRGG